MSKPRTLYDKIWDTHVVHASEDGTSILYIDRHLVHEVTRPQASDGLRTTGRRPRRPDTALAVPDHNAPTNDRSKCIAAERSRIQVEPLWRDADQSGSPRFQYTAHTRGRQKMIRPGD